MLAFRHPQSANTLCLGYLFSQLIPKVAQEQKIDLNNPIHVHFIYDRGIFIWAGKHIGWIASNLGGTPIQLRKADWMGLRSALDLYISGKFPMAAAPSGATNGLSEIVSPLEPGIAQMGFWCAEDLQKAGRKEEDFIVPVGLKYSYINEPSAALANLSGELETASSLSVTSDNNATFFEVIDTHNLGLSEHLLSLMEQSYTKLYYQIIADKKILNGEIKDRYAAFNYRL
jgi:hypothetical protein